MLKKRVLVSLRPLLFKLWNWAVGRVNIDAGGAEFGNCSGRPGSAISVGKQTVRNNSRVKG